MSSKTDQGASNKGAGLYDIRNFIGLLLLIYGVLLSATGLLADPGFAKTGGINANLFTGLALLVAGAVFMLWAKLKPVDTSGPAPESDSPDGH